jgi:hypothetical protein
LFGGFEGGAERGKGVGIGARSDVARCCEGEVLEVDLEMGLVS